MQLTEIVVIKGEIELKTGLHIGGGDAAMQIGGIDNPVIKHPNTHEPFIPGSSLKGKIRSLLESKLGLVKINDGKPADLKKSKDNDNARKIVKLFGNHGTFDMGKNDEKVLGESVGPTRVRFVDCMVKKEFATNVKQIEDFTYFEDKTENSINRISGTVSGHGKPRHSERVPSGVIFDFEVAVKIIMDGDKKLVDLLLDGMKLLELDYLGGYGSRGYGKIEFKNLKKIVGDKEETIELPKNPFGS